MKRLQGLTLASHILSRGGFNLSGIIAAKPVLHFLPPGRIDGPLLGMIKSHNTTANQ